MNIRSTAIEVLGKVRKRLSDPKAWMQNGLARDKYGGRVAPDSPQAVKWCLTGAMDAELTGLPMEEMRMVALDAIDLLMRQVRNKTPYILLASFNDSSPHRDVLALLDNTLKANRREQ